MKVQQLLVVGIVVVLIVIGTYFEGMRTSRWGDPKSEVLDSYKAAIQDFPVAFGDWNGDLSTESRDLTDLVAKEAGAEASLSRNYHSDSVSRDIMINIICGFSRKVAIHTPDACYRGAGFHIEGEITTVKVPYIDRALQAKYAAEGEMQAAYKAQKEAEFRTALFVREEQNGLITRQRVFWTWKGADSDWIAPEIPRNRWRPVDPLCKMYISTIEGPTETPLSESPIFEFGKVLFPDLEPFFNGTYTEGKIRPEVNEEAVTGDAAKGDALSGDAAKGGASKGDAAKGDSSAKGNAEAVPAAKKAEAPAADKKAPATKPAEDADSSSDSMDLPALDDLDANTMDFSEKFKKDSGSKADKAKAKQKEQDPNFLPELPSDILAPRSAL